MSIFSKNDRYSHKNWGRIIVRLKKLAWSTSGFAEYLSIIKKSVSLDGKLPCWRSFDSDAYLRKAFPCFFAQMMNDRLSHDRDKDCHWYYHAILLINRNLTLFRFHHLTFSRSIPTFSEVSFFKSVKKFIPGHFPPQMATFSIYKRDEANFPPQSHPTPIP
jgi:hypothetical protein